MAFKTTRLSGCDAVLGLPHVSLCLLTLHLFFVFCFLFLFLFCADVRCCASAMLCAQTLVRMVGRDLVCVFVDEFGRMLADSLLCFVWR